MSFKDSVIVDNKGNTGHWKCKGCVPRNDKHGTNQYGDPCPFNDKPLSTWREDPKNSIACSPAYCKKCGCHYSNGCPEHSEGEQVSLSKR